MNKKLIRLTESDLHRIVKKSVNKVLKEGIGGGRYAVIHTTDYPADGRGHVSIYNSIDEFTENSFDERFVADFLRMNVGDVISTYDGYDIDGYEGIIVIRIE